MIVIIRELKDSEDLTEATKLAVLCFHEPIKSMEKLFSETQDLDMLGAFKDDSLLAAAGSFKYQMFIRDKLFDCAGIAAVMTLPAERRRGYIKKLMHKILTDRQQQGYLVAALWPFDHDFYSKFGFDNGEKAISYNFKPSNIKSDFKLDDNIKVTDITDKKDYLPLLQVAKNAKNKYTRIIGDVDAWLLRGELQGGFKIYLFERDDIPIAYVSFKFKKSGEWDQTMQVLDFAYIDIQAKHSLFAFLRNFEADISKISINLPIQEEVERYLKSVDDTHKFNTWPAMFRILDVKKCFEQLNYLPSLDEELHFKVEDKIISDNNGIWKLAIKDGKCTTSKIDSTSTDKENILDLSINQLSQILIGHSSIEKILENSDITIPEKWKNKDLFPEMPCSVMLWF